MRLTLASWLLFACGQGAPGADVTGPYFEHAMFFNRDVKASPVAPDSAQMIAALRAAGGWGNEDHFRVDKSFAVLRADGSPAREFTPSASFVSPDCDLAPVPVPAAGNLEGETGYACTQHGDCHLIVIDDDAGKLYEMWHANITSTSFEGGCLAVWDTQRAYDDTLRGDQCTSADAAGLPIAPMLLDVDEVIAGSIDHALRFVLPNDRIRQGFVRPATHGAFSAGDPGAPFYGLHLRLRSDFPVETLTSTGAQVVARTLQRYGMYLADGGDDTLTAIASPRWDGLLGTQDLYPLKVEDFEVIDHGPMFPLTNSCRR